MSKVIWALFDDCEGSWNGLGHDNIISIGIRDNPTWKNYYKIDLGVQNSKLIKQLSKLPKPDMIVASPPCECWSIADNQQRLFRKRIVEGNVDILHIYNEKFYEEHNAKTSKNLIRSHFKGISGFLSGMGTIYGLKLIIEHFKPLIWVIENPQSSKLWDFFPNGVDNLVYYNNWDETFTSKPTNFKSNINLGFPPRVKIKSHCAWGSVSGYKRRSSIPQKLLEEILKVRV